MGAPLGSSVPGLWAISAAEKRLLSKGQDNVFLPNVLCIYILFLKATCGLLRQILETQNFLSTKNRCV